MYVCMYVYTHIHLFSCTYRYIYTYKLGTLIHKQTHTYTNCCPEFWFWFLPRIFSSAHITHTYTRTYTHHGMQASKSGPLPDDKHKHIWKIKGLIRYNWHNPVQTAVFRTTHIMPPTSQLPQLSNNQRSHDKQPDWSYGLLRTSHSQCASFISLIPHELVPFQELLGHCGLNNICSFGTYFSLFSCLSCQSR